MNLLIGLSGHMRSGKDTACTLLQAICSLQSIPAVRLAFADQLKADAREYGWDGEKNEFGRFLLQWLGQSKRELDPDYWVRRASTTLDEMPARNQIVIVSDVRHENEAEWVRSAGSYGEVWRVEKICARLQDSWDPGRSHVSESALDQHRFDRRLVVHEGDFADMTACLRVLLEDFIATVVAKGMFWR